MPPVYEGIIATGSDTLIIPIDIPAATPLNSYLLVCCMTATYLNSGFGTFDSPAFVYDDAPLDLDRRYGCYPDSEPAIWPVDGWGDAANPSCTVGGISGGITLNAPAMFASAKRPLSPVPAGTTVHIVPNTFGAIYPAWYEIESFIVLFSECTRDPDKMEGAAGTTTGGYNPGTGASTYTVTPRPPFDIVIATTYFQCVRFETTVPHPVEDDPGPPSWNLETLADQVGGMEFAQTVTEGGVTEPRTCNWRNKWGYHIQVGGGAFVVTTSVGGPFIPGGFPPAFSWVGIPNTQPGGTPYCEIPNLHFNRTLKVSS